MPENAYPKTGHRLQPRPPSLFQIGIAMEIGNGGGNAFDGSRAQQPRQAEQRNMHIEGWQRIAPSQHLIDSGEAAQQTQQLRLTLQNH